MALEGMRGSSITIQEILNENVHYNT